MCNQKTFISSQRKIVQFKKLILKNVNSSKIGVQRKLCWMFEKKHFFKCEFPLIFPSFNSADGLSVHSFNKNQPWPGEVFQFVVAWYRHSQHQCEFLKQDASILQLSFHFPSEITFFFCCWLSLYRTASFTWFYKNSNSFKVRGFQRQWNLCITATNSREDDHS